MRQVSFGKGAVDRATSFRNPLRKNKSPKTTPETGKLHVTVLEAHDLPIKDHHVGKTKGVFCVLYLTGRGDIPKEDRKTNKSDPLHCQWNQEFIFEKAEVSDRLILILRDKVLVGKSHMIGQIEIPVSNLIANQITTQWFPCPLQEGNSKLKTPEILLKLQFIPAEEMTPRAASLTSGTHISASVSASSVGSTPLPSTSVTSSLHTNSNPTQKLGRHSTDQDVNRAASRTVTFGNTSVATKAQLRASVGASAYNKISKDNEANNKENKKNTSSNHQKDPFQNSSFNDDDDVGSLSSNTSTSSNSSTDSNSSNNVIEEEDDDRDSGLIEIVNIKRLLSIPSNNMCCECGRLDPEWASVKLGIFLCLQCSSIHRSLGSHISQVRSIYLDTWSQEQVLLMKGNVQSKAYWEANIPPGLRAPSPSDPAMVKEKWIRNKYLNKVFLSEQDKEAEREKEKEREEQLRSDSQTNLIEEERPRDRKSHKNKSEQHQHRMDEEDDDAPRVVLGKKKAWWQKICPCCF